MVPIETARAAERIERERSEVVHLVEALTIELDEIVESVSLSNNDDEHDPDGATNGYERAKATALLRRAEERLVELDRASGRLRDGTYGRCELCGGEIGAERLDALVATTTCVVCAA
jgi:RNA polymerase-binding transcription factor DksA